MERGMTFRYRHESSATSRANFSATAQRSLDSCLFPFRFDDFRGKENRTVCRRWAQQLNGVIRGHRAWRPIFTSALHQMPGRGPVAVAIEQRADDSAVEDTGKRFVFLLRFPFCHDFVAADETANVQPVRVGRPATEAGVRRRVKFLKRLRAVAHFDPLLARDPG